MIEICKHNECTGCFACVNTCRHSAISMTPNEFGYIHPVINQDNCIDCGACAKVCPNNTIPVFLKSISAFVGCANDHIEQLSSTSGGIASVLSRFVVREGGVVYGCSGFDCKNVHHIRVEKESDLERIKGSKYVQSKIGNIFRAIHEDLRGNRKVVFIGTPCQVAGLLSFLPKGIQDNLLTVDFVCHGVPSQQLLNDALDYLLPNVSKDTLNLQFRIKKWQPSILSKTKIVDSSNIKQNPINIKYSTQYGLFAKDSKNWILNSPFPMDDYMVGFLTGLLYRDSCYTCHYSRPERVADITLGDYHFTNQKHTPIEGENRLLSKIIVNSSKGEEIINRVEGIISAIEIDHKSLLIGKSQLTHPMQQHPLRSEFLDKYTSLGFIAASLILKRDKKRIKNHIRISKLRNSLYVIPGLKKIVAFLRK